MSLLGINDAFTYTYQYVNKKQKNTANGTNFTGQTAQVQKSPHAEKLEDFKKEIWNEINFMPWGANTSIQITDGALRKMMEDDEFKNKMMNLIWEDARGSNIMCGGTLINIDENGYKGYSYMADHAKEAGMAFAAHSKGKDSFYVKKAGKKKEYMELLEKKRLPGPRARQAVKDKLDALLYANAQGSTESFASSGKIELVSEADQQSGTEKAGSTKALSQEEEMELFKKEFYEDLSKVTRHRTVSNAAVNISEAAFKAMKDDPQYREKVLSLIQRDLGDSYAPRNCSVLITVGATLNEYRGDSWPVGYDSEFNIRSKNSFYKRTNEKKERQKELLEEYLEKRAKAKKQQQKRLKEKIAKQEQERSSLSQSRMNERQMAKASNAYEANIMMVTAVESASLPG